MKRVLFASAALILYSTAALSRTGEEAAKGYTASLDPVAFQALTKDSVGGSGKIMAKLDGTELVVEGTFSRLPAPASRARLFSGTGIGVPGEPITDLSVDARTAGRIAGRIKVDPTLIAALAMGHIYIRIDTSKNPDGAAWGWFLPLDTARRTWGSE